MQENAHCVAQKCHYKHYRSSVIFEWSSRTLSGYTDWLTDLVWSIHPFQLPIPPGNKVLSIKKRFVAVTTRLLHHNVMITWLVLPRIVNWLSCNVCDVIINVQSSFFVWSYVCHSGYLKSCYGAYLLFLHCPQTAVQRQNKLRYREFLTYPWPESSKVIITKVWRHAYVRYQKPKHFFNFQIVRELKYECKPI